MSSRYEASYRPARVHQVRYDTYSYKSSVIIDPSTFTTMIVTVDSRQWTVDSVSILMARKRDMDENWMIKSIPKDAILVAKTGTRLESVVIIIIIMAMSTPLVCQHDILVK